MLSVLSCRNFRSGWTGAAHPSATQFFRAALAENCFPKPPLDLLICCQFAPDLISARGGRAPRIQAQIAFSALHLLEITFQDLPSSFLYAVSSFLSQFPLGVDGRRAPQRNSMFPRRACGELLCKTSLGSRYMLSVLSCLNFRSGWTGAAHPSATQFFCAALAGNCVPRPPLDLLICCQFSPVLISARGGRAPRTPAQLVVSAPRLRRIAVQDLPWISLYVVSSLLS